MASHNYDLRLFARIEFLLKRRIEIATKEHYRAGFDCWRLTSMPGIASELQLSEAARMCDLKQNALALALTRLNDFIVKGTVPEDLRRPEHTGEISQSSSFV